MEMYSGSCALIGMVRVVGIETERKGSAYHPWTVRFDIQTREWTPNIKTDETCSTTL